MERRTKTEQRMLGALADAISKRMKQLEDTGATCNFETISKASGVSAVTVSRLVRKREGVNIVTVMRIFNSLDLPVTPVLVKFEKVAT